MKKWIKVGLLLIAVVVVVLIFFELNRFLFAYLPTLPKESFRFSLGLILFDIANFITLNIYSIIIYPLRLLESLVYNTTLGRSQVFISLTGRPSIFGFVILLSFYFLIGAGLTWLSEVVFRDKFKKKKVDKSPDA